MNKTNDIDIIADFIIRNPDLAKIEYPELLTCLENRMIEKSPIFTAAIIDKFSKNLNSAVIIIY